MRGEGEEEMGKVGKEGVTEVKVEMEDNFDSRPHCVGRHSVMGCLIQIGNFQPVPYRSDVRSLD